MSRAASRRPSHSTLLIVAVLVIGIAGIVYSRVRQAPDAGTVAAAVTSVHFSGATSAIPGQPFHMLVDRPFLFGIKDGLTGVLLFAGCVYDP